MFQHPPIRTALVTARNMPAHLRVLNTLRAWDVHVDEAFFLGGVPKTKMLKAFNPHIYFDDQDAHCGPASGVVSTGRVPYGVAKDKATSKAVASIRPKASRALTVESKDARPRRSSSKRKK